MRSLSTNCAQYVSTARENRWYEYPQSTAHGWINDFQQFTSCGYTHLFPIFPRPLSSPFYTPIFSKITEIRGYFSTLSTLPITITTIYI